MIDRIARRVMAYAVRLFVWWLGGPAPTVATTPGPFQHRWYYTVGPDRNGVPRVRSVHRAFPSAERTLRRDEQATAVMFEPAEVRPRRPGDRATSDNLTLWTSR